jgi:GNAT superfamily N-acetyltransferase
MDLKLRPGSPEDAQICGRICYEAFSRIAGEHNFPTDFTSPDVAAGLLSMLLGHPGFYSVVAEVNGEVVGSNFLDERSTIPGIGPVTVDPAVQNRGVGRVLMQDVTRRAADRGAPGIRLLQAAYHSRSLSLYAKLGFQVRDLLACMQGTRRRARSPATGSGAPTPPTSRRVPLSAGGSTGMTAPAKCTMRSRAGLRWWSSTTGGSAATPPT